MSKSKTNNKSKNKTKKRKGTGLRVFCAIFGLLVGVFLYFYFVLGKTYVNIPIISSADYSTIELAEGSLTGGDVDSAWKDGGHTRVYYNPKHPIIEVERKDPDVENILVFGVDSRKTSDYKCRSDAMMVVSINESANTVKLTSLMRDTGVYIGDTDDTAKKKLDKLNAAYAYGGVGLMINTINRTFDLDIQRFVMLDFTSAAKVIDLCGGVEITVSSAEVKYANEFIAYQNKWTGSQSPNIQSSGRQTLNGTQAIAWSRIRYLDSDFVRTSRQRTIAQALIEKVSKLSYFEQLSLLDKSTGMFETNMRPVDLGRVAMAGAKGADNLTQYRVPEDNMYTVQSNPWMMIIDFEQTKTKLHNYIWGT
ncbi:transcriptional attenuator, LytR family [Ruminococcaceae bacterium YRB3002]|nr:transcriptional attenuator, LytR family [Ruminococcaceae bacterium YRB3002]